jgi:hypothetical protein
MPKEHRKNKRPSTLEKHQKGLATEKRSKQGEAGDKRRRKQQRKRRRPEEGTANA